jgi:hypothetical protein
MRESDVAKACISYLQYKNCIVTRLNSGKWQNAITGSWIQGCPAGTPDYCIAIPKDGYYLFAYLEVKANYGTLNNDQIAFLRTVPKGVPWCVVNDSKQLEQWLEKPWEYHGEYRLVKDVTDPTKKFVPVYTGKQKRRNSPMNLDIFMQHEKFTGRGNKQEEPLDQPPF